MKPTIDDSGFPKLNPERKSLSVCICMYSEEKSMLRNTLKGV